jgi:rhomboid family GlyGly-CTERM serine protease
MLWPQALTQFRYDRVALSSGEWWRIATGHMVHLNMPHLLLNLFGLFLLCELLWRDLPWRHGLGLLVSAALGTGALLFWLHPELAWYAGLSGALHGLWSGCALAGLRSMQTGAGLPDRAQVPESQPGPGFSYISIAAMIALLLKLGIEFHHGPSSDTMQRIGGAVITAGHRYGALTGICYVLIWQGMRFIRSKK